MVDVVGFYSGISLNAQATINMDNTDGLTRCLSDKNLQIIAILQSDVDVNANVCFTINYTNQDGVSGCQSSLVKSNVGSTKRGQVFNSAATNFAGSAGGNLFIPLQAGDSGVKSIQSLTITPDGVTTYGNITLAIVKPVLTTIITHGSSNMSSYMVYTEVDFFKDHNVMPYIEPDALLIPFINQSIATTAGNTFMCELQTVWE